MNSLPAFFAVMTGVFVGLLCVPLVTHWMALLLTALGKPDPRKVGASLGRVWAIVFTVLHPVPWILLFGLPLGIHRLIVNAPTQPWRWFWAGASTSFFGVFILGFLMTRKVREQIELNAAAKRAESRDVV